MTQDTSWAKVYYTDVWGTREEKLAALEQGGFPFRELSIDPEMAYFIPLDSRGKDAYEQGVSLYDLFPVNVTGVVTGNDRAAIAPTRSALEKRLDMVRHASGEKDILDLWGKFGRGQAANTIQSDVLSEGVITPISFRPFDVRWTYYSGASCGWILWPREKATMGHLLAAPTSPIGENIGIVFCKPSGLYTPPFVTQYIADNRLFSASCERAYIAPLYLYTGPVLDGGNWTANLDEKAFRTLTRHLPAAPSPIDVFDYVYGILHDPAYCEKYAAFLARDFPRVPIIDAPEDMRGEDAFFVSKEMYRAYVSAGRQLRKLHLMQVKAPAELTLEPNTPLDRKIGTVKYKNGILHLNESKRMVGIPEAVWNYQIGGYRVLAKWFKEHKGETLTADSFTHIENVVGLLAQTLAIQERLRGLHA